MQPLILREAEHRIVRELGPARTMREAADVWKMIGEHFDLKSLKEHFWVILLDGRHRMTYVECVSIGTLNHSLVHPREVFRLAIRESAAALIVAHNHPSGELEPSSEDRDVTQRLREAGKILGIDVLDSLVLTSSSYRQVEITRTGEAV